MRLGFTLPQMGNLASPEAIVKVATEAEHLGFDSLWVADRVLWPVQPRAPYPATPDGSLPDMYKRVCDPLLTLTFAAAHTRRVMLGTSILNMPYYNPVLVGRQLTTLDVLSNGRLCLGLGMGWSPDEFEAVGTDMKTRAGRADEFLQVLKKMWTENPVEFRGRYYTVPESIIDLKPVQKPHPPILLSAYTPAAMARTARSADGWNPAGIPIEGMKQMFAGIQGMAAQAGRDPAALKLVVRANIYLTDGWHAPERPIYCGSMEQIRADVAATRALGADELIFEIFFSPGMDTMEKVLTHMHRFWDLAHAA